MTIACPDCGAVQEVRPLPAGIAAHCRACGLELERSRGRSVALAAVASAAALALLLAAVLLPLMQVSMLGLAREVHVATAVVILWRHGWVVLSVFALLAVVVLPLVRLGLLSAVLSWLSLGSPGLRGPWLGKAFRWALALDAWAMPDVFLIGCAVGYSRVRVNLPVHIGVGGYCLTAAAILCIVLRALIDQRAVWRMLRPDRPAPPRELIACRVCDYVLSAERENTPCPRCGHRMTARKRDAVTRTAALAAPSRSSARSEVIGSWTASSNCSRPDSGRWAF